MFGITPNPFDRDTEEYEAWDTITHPDGEEYPGAHDYARDILFGGDRDCED